MSKDAWHMSEVRTSATLRLLLCRKGNIIYKAKNINNTRIWLITLVSGTMFRLIIHFTDCFKI